MQRSVDFTFQGAENGPIRGLLPDSELRERLKPFVFLDHFDVATDGRWGFDFHPHSGVATFTVSISSAKMFSPAVAARASRARASGASAL